MCAGVEVLHAGGLGLLLNIKLLFALSIKFTHSAQIAVILMVLDFVVVPRPGLLHGRLGLLLVGRARGLLGRRRPDAHFDLIFVFLGHVHVVLAVLGLREGLLPARLELLGHHRLDVGLRVVLLEGSLRRLRKNQLILNLIRVHLVEDEGPLQRLVDGVDGLPVLDRELGLHRVLGGRLVLVALINLRLTINRLGNFLRRHELGWPVGVLRLLLLEVRWASRAHLEHDFVIILLF